MFTVMGLNRCSPVAAAHRGGRQRLNIHFKPSKNKKNHHSQISIFKEEAVADESWSKLHPSLVQGRGGGAKTAEFQLIRYPCLMKVFPLRGEKEMTPQSKHFKGNNPRCMPGNCKCATNHMRERDERGTGTQSVRAQRCIQTGAT